MQTMARHNNQTSAAILDRTISMQTNNGIGATSARTHSILDRYLDDPLVRMTFTLLNKQKQNKSSFLKFLK